MNTLKKISILGGESTGKSTLSAQLAMHFDTTWVAEYARIYLEQKHDPYEYKDLLLIAKGQLALEEKELKKANKFLFCDTDLNVLKVWSEHSYQQCEPFILQQLAIQIYDAYILTSPDMPWVHDPLREYPDPEMRKYFFELYHAIIQNTHAPYCIVSGNEEERLIMAIEFVEKLE